MNWNQKSSMVWDWGNISLVCPNATESSKSGSLPKPTDAGMGATVHGSVLSSDITFTSSSELGHGSSKSSMSASTGSPFKEGIALEFTFPAVSGEASRVEDSGTSAAVCHGEPLISLKLGKRTYFEKACEGEDGKNCATKCTTSVSTIVKKTKVSQKSTQNSYCQVEGCNADLSSAKDYHRKHKVCEAHSKAPKVVVAGLERRFCQQCSRLHGLAEFDQNKRSCRRRLSHHNARRRKPQTDTISFGSSRLSTMLYATPNLTSGINMMPLRMHRWIIPSCGDMRPAPRPGRRRDQTPPPPRQQHHQQQRPSSTSSPPKLRKVGSEGTLAIPRDVEEFRTMSAPYGHLRLFTHDELRRATRDFDTDQIIGEGGFGVVYLGVIDDGAARNSSYPPATKEVAVKELNPEGLQGDREWLTEVSYLGQYSHQNLVELIGYCCEDDHRLLVYEYMANGSLENHLFRRSCNMTWTTRIRIARDVARGLAFLHGAERPIIYRDFKTSNILLDADFNAKLSDFGLAKEGPMGGKTHVSTRVMGTYGYAAPEYMATGHLTAMSDVYGFGVVLLEMLVGRRALEPSRAGAREGSLVDWARPILIRPKKLERIMDRRMGEVGAGGQFSKLERVARLAYDCLSQNPKVRPTMARVVQILDAVLAADGDGDATRAADNAPAR